jgi:ArsR family transcriptional regulator, arsenate/arsenite/antimonite-responsive transcriptional repressor
MTYFCVINFNRYYMTASKSELFDNELQESAQLFKALGHPARLAILQYLSEKKVCITGNIADELPLSRTTVNQHLKELRDAGLIKGTTSGAKTNYCINAATIGELKRSFTTFFENMDFENQQC